ncbi:MAG: XdhC family protein [Planctomycetota bacterium]|jgi:xanthine dehydrogenase accessory factor
MEDLKVYEKAVQLLKKDENIALVTVISTTGSTPGKVGYKMLVWGKKPETIGTVGGGLNEAEMIIAAKNILPKTENIVFTFDKNGSFDEEKGICGGSIEFLIETFDKKSLPFFEELSTVLKNSDKGVLISIISPKKALVKILLENIEQINTAANINLSLETIESIREIIDKEQRAKINAEGLEIFIETISEQPTIFIFGAGHLAYYISKFVKELGFNVTVCDDRAEFANRQRFPDADKIIVENFENLLEELKIGRNSYIVIVTKGHKCDTVVLEQALETDAKYIGMIGSKRKVATVLKKLNEKGIPEEKLKKVFSPIGISIGALTPQEIALSIVCELVKIRRAPDTDKIKHMKICFSEELQEKPL